MQNYAKSCNFASEKTKEEAQQRDILLRHWPLFIYCIWLVITDIIIKLSNIIIIKLI